MPMSLWILSGLACCYFFMAIQLWGTSQLQQVFPSVFVLDSISVLNRQFSSTDQHHKLKHSADSGLVSCSRLLPTPVSTTSSPWNQWRSMASNQGDFQSKSTVSLLLRKNQQQNYMVFQHMLLLPSFGSLAHRRPLTHRLGSCVQQHETFREDASASRRWIHLLPTDAASSRRTHLMQPQARIHSVHI